MIEIPSPHVSGGTGPPRPGKAARPFLFKLLNFKDHDTILAKARTMNASLITDKTKASLYPYFSTELQRTRVTFNGVKQRLRRLNVTYAILYPAHLRMVANDETQFF